MTPSSFSRFHSRALSISLRALLIGLMVVQICLPFGLVGWLSFHHGEQSVQVLTKRIYQQAISQVQHHLDDYFASLPQLNQLNLASDCLGLLPLDDFATLGHLFWKQMQIFEVSYVNYANEQGAFIGVERLEDGSLLIHETLANNVNVFTSYETDAAGNRTQGESVIDTAPIQEEGWYAAAAAAGQPVWSEIYQWDDKPEVLSISSSYPTYTESGQLSGVIGVDLLLSDIGEFLKTVNISSHSELYILERSGDVVASSTKEPPFIVVDGEAQRLNAAASQQPQLRRAIAALEEQFGSLAAINWAQKIALQSENTIVYGVPWQNEYGLDWLVVATVSESDFMTQIEASAYQTIALGLLALTLAIWCASMTARWVTATLQNLNLAATAIANGEFDTPYLQCKATRLPLIIQEVENLKRSFRCMALQLQTNFQQLGQVNGELEARVLARTTELRQSEEKFAKAFSQSPVAIAISTIEEGRFIEANAACCRILEYAAPRLIGRTSLELGIWPYPEERDHMLQDLQRDGFTAAREVHLGTQSGRIICAEIAVSVIELNGQKRLLFVGNDVSDRKQAESERRRAELAVQESEARFRRLANQAPIFIWMTGTDGGCSYINQTWCEFTGLTQAASLGTGWTTMIHADDRAMAQATYQAAFEQCQPFTTRYRVRHRDGHYRWFLVKGVPRFIDQNTFEGYVGICNDIHDLQQTEEQLRQSQRSLIAAQQIAHVGHWEFDLGTQAIHWSEEMFHIFGRDPAQGEPSYEEYLNLINPSDRERLVQCIERAIATGNGYTIEHQVIINGAINRCVVGKTEVSKDASGRVLKLFGIAQDVTETKQFESQLKASLHEKEILLKEIHHRVKNNLHVVANLLDLQTDYIQDEHIASIFTDSQSRIQTMALIHEQLYQSKDLQEIDFESYICRLVQNLMFSYGEAASRINLEFQVSSIFLNIETAIPCGLLINELVTNALKHGFPHQASGTVYIGFQAITDGYFELIVRDDGIGIDPSIFSAKSTSFGLKLIGILTRQLKAEISIDSHNGTQFQFRFRELAYKPRV